MNDIVHACVHLIHLTHAFELWGDSPKSNAMVCMDVPGVHGPGVACVRKGVLELMHTVVNPCHESMSAWAFRRQVSIMCAVQHRSCSVWLEHVAWRVHTPGG